MIPMAESVVAEVASSCHRWWLSVNSTCGRDMTMVTAGRGCLRLSEAVADDDI